MGPGGDKLGVFLPDDHHRGIRFPENLDMELGAADAWREKLAKENLSTPKIHDFCEDFVTIQRKKLKKAKKRLDRVFLKKMKTAFMIEC